MEITVARLRIRNGLKANLPSSGLFCEPFYCTDTEELFIWDGTQMVKVSGGGSTALAALTDVSLSGNTDGQVLTYNSPRASRKNKAGSSSLAGDTDVQLTEPEQRSGSEVQRLEVG